MFNKHLKFNVTKQNCLAHPIHPSPEALPISTNGTTTHPVVQFQNLRGNLDCSLSFIFTSKPLASPGSTASNNYSGSNHFKSVSCASPNPSLSLPTGIWKHPTNCSLCCTFFPLMVFLHKAATVISSFLDLRRYNWHIILFRFKLYNVLNWFISTLQSDYRDCVS